MKSTYAADSPEAISPIRDGGYGIGLFRSSAKSPSLTSLASSKAAAFLIDPSPTGVIVWAVIEKPNV